jgi:hypothetical protein
MIVSNATDDRKDRNASVIGAGSDGIWMTRQLMADGHPLGVQV